ncbi:MAG: hypothetical protein ACR2PB_03200 [Desulfocapsaceae bacterium]
MMRESFSTKVLTILCGVLLLFPTLVNAADDISGWEEDSEYNELYNPKERDSIKGDILKFITVTPIKGMAPGTAFILDEGGGDKVVVHVCPESYASGRETGLRRGDWVKVKGVWADIGDESIFIAAKIRKDNEYAFKVRLTSDGTPFWTLSPERLAEEIAAVE